ncbi:alpha/beta family hydrolase [Piscinibacter sakaiensis]|uniref:Bll0118 protein n=1 Tax=Piscinibacter sakaiensis TaxID=1547922 RepID=A0A0K8P8B9_PISS1|nr:alpha/beta family hydrolase [Piscinibacter sakaiensis]GAP38882.1 bll0118 protein [Piscinibacter sakaiensis]
MLLLPLAAPPARAEQALTLPTPRGEPLVALLDRPDGAGPEPVPLVVLAPGQGYHMALPALAGAARRLREQGLAVLRFDWAYHRAEPRGRPSPALAREVEDLRAAVAAARRLPGIDAARVLVGGKSLGSLVAWRVFAEDPALRGALLLTPVCSRPGADGGPGTAEAAANYPGLAAEARPVLWLQGDRDPLCATALLWPQLAALAGPALRVAVVGGDHGFGDRRLPAPQAALATERHVDAAARLAAGFVQDVLAAPPAAAAAATAPPAAAGPAASPATPAAAAPSPATPATPAAAASSPATPAAAR